MIEDFLTLLYSIDKKEERRLPLKTHSYQKFSDSIHEYANSHEAEEEYSYWDEKVKQIEPLYEACSENSKVKNSLKLKRALSRQMTQKLLSPWSLRIQAETAPFLNFWLHIVLRKRRAR
ncbi:hypothetical protein ACHADS_16885 [Bacillus vallismortis]|uniref:hypothetical protein n=1 Tax=Bacillus vallismortis TaxID=72361 RepID=UPI00374D1AE0